MPTGVRSPAGAAALALAWGSRGWDVSGSRSGTISPSSGRQRRVRPRNRASRGRGAAGGQAQPAGQEVVAPWAGFVASSGNANQQQVPLLDIAATRVPEDDDGISSGPSSQALPSSPSVGDKPEELPQCRICFDSKGPDGSTELLSPCQCRGSQKFVHPECLGRWQACMQSLRGRGAAQRCDVCRTRLPVALNLLVVPAVESKRVVALLGLSPRGTSGVMS